jgi:prolyl-tRNA synthetase
MPLGLRVLRKVENIVREEMNRAGRARTADAGRAARRTVAGIRALGEIRPGTAALQGSPPARLRHRPDARGSHHRRRAPEVKSYRQLPIHFYQIQTKFRDEIRPRFGVMRGREFLMKDGYSFHTRSPIWSANTATCTTPTAASSPAWPEIPCRGGRHRLDRRHRLARIPRAGRFRRRRIAFCPDSDYAANVELAEAVAPPRPRAAAKRMEKVATPGKMACEDVAEFLGVPLTRSSRRLPCSAKRRRQQDFALLLLRGDHDLNEIKASKIARRFPLPLRHRRRNRRISRLQAGLHRPGAVDGKKVVFADRSVAAMSDFVCGANEAGFHLTGVNFGRDLPEPEVADLRNVVAGDPSPDGKGKLEICRGIEVGHIFQLRTKYAEALKCAFLDENGKSQIMEMGCYGIGVSRIVGAAIEQGNDERGIIFPPPSPPSRSASCRWATHKSEAVKAAADRFTPN